MLHALPEPLARPGGLILPAGARVPTDSHWQTALWQGGWELSWLSKAKWYLVYMRGTGVLLSWDNSEGPSQLQRHPQGQRKPLLSLQTLCPIRSPSLPPRVDPNGLFQGIPARESPFQSPLPGELHLGHALCLKIREREWRYRNSGPITAPGTRAP